MKPRFDSLLTLTSLSRLLNNIDNPTCDMFEKFNQLIVQHEICLANVCQTTNDDATVDEDQINGIFTGTALENKLDDMKTDVRACAIKVATFMNNNGGDIVTAWTNGANA